jgi:adenine phosphoribosyltransferase
VDVTADTIKDAIRDIPDFPVDGIIFKDITPILRDPVLLKGTLDLFEQAASKLGITKIAAIDARGFIFGGALADRMNIGFVPIRKQGKLPFDSYAESYELEYGSNTLEIHQDAFEPGEKVLILDDLLATGGTAQATVTLVEKAGGSVAALFFLIELSFLNGRDKLSGHTLFSPITY